MFQAWGELESLLTEKGWALRLLLIGPILSVSRLTAEVDRSPK